MMIHRIITIVTIKIMEKTVRVIMGKPKPVEEVVEVKVELGLKARVQVKVIEAEVNHEFLRVCFDEVFPHLHH